MPEYIDREAAMEAVLDLSTKTDEDGYVWIMRGVAWETLLNFPTADVQPVKHGRWSGYSCSNCGISKYNFISFNFDDKNGYARPFGTWNYCPRCGAKMDGET